MVCCDPEKQQQGKTRLCILGSTGSIGQSALQIVRDNRDRFEVVALAAGSNVEELKKQILEFHPKVAALHDEKAFLKLEKVLPTSACNELSCGAKSIAEITTRQDVDVVLAAIVGFAGLRSVVAALSADKIVALANKESLVCGGAIIKKLLAEGHGKIIPVDSEHSAIFQALQGQSPDGLKSLILTASGGPFFKTPIEEFSTITVEQALKHPRWKMGPKVTIDSATMMNKALEVIEAYWLFGVSEEQISVLVHPQSIVHSLVEFVDGSQLAQLSHPDMKGPIAYALRYPERMPQVMLPLDLAKIGKLDFFPLDDKKFPAVKLAKEAIKKGGAATAVFNIANEVAVKSFLNEKVGFDKIVPFVEDALNNFGDKTYSSLEELEMIDREVRKILLG
ncbi:MAG: 1-deoxy-D-xylulose-5-phosphate reductoisomerase [Bdellovibrionota bacterium]|jgi:1-deoxy-D-xylulose-5-phosphate reductoisomerase